MFREICKERGVVVGSASKSLLNGAVALGAAITAVSSPGAVVEIGYQPVTFAAGSYTESQLRADLIAGRNGGSWNGSSGIIVTSSGIPSTMAVGYVIKPDGSAVVAFAAPGDTDLSGAVNVFDLVTINGSGKYGTGVVAKWQWGDFNYDGVTNVFDVVGINTSGVYGQGNYRPALEPSYSLENRVSGETVSMVPEPTSLGLLLLGAGSLTLRRHRNVQRG